MIYDPLYILTVLALLVLATEWLVRHTWLRHLGGALLVILLAAIASNAGIIPASSSATRPVVVYDGIFGFLAPLAIFWLLLPVNLKDIRRAGGPMITLFLVGSVGTALGVLLAFWVVDAPNSIGELYQALGGMFLGTYTGGGVNFNALALEFDVVKEGALYGGVVAVDNIITAVWMMATIALPRLVAPLWRGVKTKGTGATIPAGTVAAQAFDEDRPGPVDFSVLIALAIGCLWLSRLLTGWFGGMGWSVPSIVVISLLALIAAQFGAVQRLKGAGMMGNYSIQFFLAVIGAYCDVPALKNLGSLGITLLVVAIIIVAVNGLVTFTTARLLRYEPEMAAVASQANVGGPPSALALAQSLNRPDLTLPAILTGSIGYAIGTFAGLLFARFIL